MNQRVALERFTAQASRATEHANTLRTILAAGPVAGEPEHEVVAPE